MTIKVDIGCRAVIRHSMFERRDGLGGYSHAMPPITGDAELLQSALIARPVVARGWMRLPAPVLYAVAAIVALAVLSTWGAA